MALFGRDYDRDFGMNRGWYSAYDSGYRGRGPGGMRGGGMRYGADYGDRKSRWQTDYGDPFGDRAAHTPMRMIRGGYRNPYDRDMQPPRYDRGFDANAMGNDAYHHPAHPATRAWPWNRGYGRSYQTRGYDRGWW